MDCKGVNIFFQDFTNWPTSINIPLDDREQAAVLHLKRCSTCRDRYEYSVKEMRRVMRLAGSS